jgi:hypothetical protein
MLRLSQSNFKLSYWERKEAHVLYDLLTSYAQDGAQVARKREALHFVRERIFWCLRWELCTE